FRCRHMDAYNRGEYTPVEQPAQPAEEPPMESHMTTFTCYLHSNKEQMLEIGEKLGLQGEALRMFAFAFSEMEIFAEVNLNTGLVVAKRVDGAAVVPQP